MRITKPEDTGSSEIESVSHRLADGREIIYFFDRDSDSPVTPAKDSRPPEDRQITPSLRFDYFTREWVSIATSRGNRTHLPAKNNCPLCVQTNENHSEIPDTFDVVVFENKNPSFGPEIGAIPNDEGQKLGVSVPAFGRCEVVVFSPDHEGLLAGLGQSRMQTVIAAWTQRTRELMSIDGVKSVFVFENRGEEIGVTLHHPHGQLYSYPMVPPKLQQMLDSAEAYGTNFFEDVIKFEESGERLLLANSEFIAFVPFGARWPVEISILSRNAADLTELGAAGLGSLADIYSKVLAALDNLYPTPTPYISSVYQKPKGLNSDLFRLQIKITSPRRAKNKLKFLAGSESGMGTFISDLSPEEVANSLRGLIN